MSDPAICVLGAGLAGLSASVALRQRGVPHRVFEAASEVGGLARSTREAGYTFDRTGHLLHLRDPSIEALVREVVEPENLLEVERKSTFYAHGAYAPYPFQANVAGLPKELAFACLRDFVRAHFTEPKPPIRTFEDHCVAHFGRAMTDALLAPYNEKVWGMHPRELSADWCERFVPRPALDDVLRGALGLAHRPLGYNTRFLFPRFGIGMLAEGLRDRAGSVELAAPVSEVDLAARTLTVNGERVPFRRLISTLPLPALVSRLRGAPPEIEAAASTLRSVDLHYLDLALNTPCEIDDHWVYVPDPSIPFYRVGVYSNFSPAMAPISKASLYVELSTKTQPVLSDVLPQVADALVAMGVIRAREAIRFARLRAITSAYVVYDAARSARVAELHAFLDAHHIASVGRYGAWEYSSMEDALRAGREAAHAVVEAFA